MQDKVAKLNSLLSKKSTLFLLNLLILFLVVGGIKLTHKKTVVTVKATALNVRTGPGLTYGVQSQIKSGTKISILKEEKKWYFVALPDGRNGWVASWLIENEKNTPVTNIEAIVNTDHTKLREKAGSEGKVIKTLKKGTEVTITLEQNGWSQVQMDQQTGWIFSDLLTEKKEIEKEKEQKRKEQKNKIYTREMSTNIRQKPDVTSTIVTTLPKDTEVKVLKKQKQWYQVKTEDDHIGYVASWVMNTKPRTEDALSTSISEATIMLDAGHGGKDSGAIGQDNTYEKDLTLETVLVLKKELEKTGAKVLLTRKEDKWVELADRPQFSNRMKPDVFISIHYDSTEGNNRATGTHTFYYHDQDKKLAHLISEQLNHLPLKHHGYSFNDLQVTRDNQYPALLLELGYINTNKDFSYIVTKEYQKQAAKRIVKGLENYFQ